jgi:hypothetical protein
MFCSFSNYSRISLYTHILSIDMLFSNHCKLLDNKVFSQIQNKIKIFADLTGDKCNLRQFLLNWSLSVYDRTHQFSNRHALLQFSRDILETRKQENCQPSVSSISYMTILKQI